MARPPTEVVLVAAGDVAAGQPRARGSTFLATTTSLATTVTHRMLPIRGWLFGLGCRTR